jgi:hypothetical protein
MTLNSTTLSIATVSARTFYQQILSLIMLNIMALSMAVAVSITTFGKTVK